MIVCPHGVAALRKCTNFNAHYTPTPKRFVRKSPKLRAFAPAPPLRLCRLLPDTLLVLPHARGAQAACPPDTRGGGAGKAVVERRSRRLPVPSGFKGRGCLSRPGPGALFPLLALCVYALLHMACVCAPQKRSAALEAIAKGRVSLNDSAAALTRQGDLAHYTMVCMCFIYVYARPIQTLCARRTR